MFKENLVSIITPSYNSSKFIKETIISVLSQSYTNWELLIVDDFSNDNSVNLINNIIQKDARIRFFPLDKNVGASTARNIAMDNAKGQYVAFLDSDDVWEVIKLEKHIKVMKKNKYPFTFSSYYVMSENGEKTGNVIKAPKVISYKEYLRNTIIGCLTVVIDRNIVGDFRMPIIKSSHDMALWLLIMKRGFCAYGIQDVLAGYRLVLTSNSAKKYKAAKDVWKVYRDIEQLSLVYSVYNFVGYLLNAIIKRIK